MAVQFTPAEDAVVRQCRAQEPPLTFVEIGERLGRSAASVYNRSLRLAVTIPVYRSHTPEEVARAIEMRTAGATWTSIGRTLGRDCNNIRDRVRRTHPWLVRSRSYASRTDVEVVAEPAAPRPETLKLNCLRCRKVFKSWSRTHNRICEACGRAPEHALPVTW